MMRRLSTAKASRVGIALAVLSGSAALAFGTGYTASRAVLGDAGAWLSKGRTVTHVNAATGVADAVVDAELVPTAGDQSVVQTSTTLAVVDTTSSTVTAVDTTTMAPGPTNRPPGGSGPLDYLVVGDRGYLIGATSVQPVSTLTLEPDGPPVEVGRAAGVVATSAGTVVVLDGDAGTVVELDGGRASLPVRVARPGPSLQLTAVGGQPVVVDAAAGTVRRVRAGGAPDEPVPVPGLAGLDRAGVAVNDRAADGSTAWLVLRAAGTLVGVDLEGREVRTGALRETGRLLQAPVVLAGKVYVASGASHTVTVVDAGTLEVVAAHEPDGTSGRLEVFAREGRVWINDPLARHALMVETDGLRATRVDKGSGHGVEEPAPGPSPQPEPGPQPDPAPESGPPPLPAPEPSPPPQPPATSAPPTTSAPRPPPPPPQVPVPNLVGQSRATACATVVALGFLCDDRPTKAAPSGTRRDAVVSQDPAPETSVPAGSPVVLTYHDPDPVAVPPVTGLRGADGGDPRTGPACLAVEQAGLVCAAIAGTAPAGGTTAADTVFDQTPAAGARVDPGDTVTVTFATTVPVPELGGATTADACRRVVSLNLVCADNDLGIGSPAGVVVAQDVAAGAAVAAGARVTVSSYSRQPVVPNVVGQAEANACALLAAERLGCAWTANPVNSAGHPAVADGQSVAPGTSVDPGYAVAVYHPAGPDTVLVRYRARRTSDGALLNQWALAPYHPASAAPGSFVYSELETRQAAWPKDGDVGYCYSAQVQGTVPLWDFVRDSASDREHQDHYYAAEGGNNYQRGLTSYAAAPADRVLCYVLPEGAPGAREVVEWWSGTSHFYTVGDPPPGGYTPIGQWRTW